MCACYFLTFTHTVHMNVLKRIQIGVKFLVFSTINLFCDIRFLNIHYYHPILSSVSPFHQPPPIPPCPTTLQPSLLPHPPLSLPTLPFLFQLLRSLYPPRGGRIELGVGGLEERREGGGRLYPPTPLPTLQPLTLSSHPSRLSSNPPTFNHCLSPSSLSDAHSVQGHEKKQQL